MSEPVLVGDRGRSGRTGRGPGRGSPGESGARCRRNHEATLRQEAWERRTRLETLKPFTGTLWVNESHPAELGQQPEASLAWGQATATAKRRQRVPRPCD